MIKAGDLFRTDSGAALKVRSISHTYSGVLLDTNGWLWVNDIKELRKFLKKLQRQLEAEEEAMGE